MSQSYWRERSKLIIDKVIKDHPNATPAELKAAIDKAYNFGPREYHPYKMWLIERNAAFIRLGIPVKQKRSKKTAR